MDQLLLPKYIIAGSKMISGRRYRPTSRLQILSRFFLLSFLSCARLSSGDDLTLLLADHLFDGHARWESVTEYKRYVFFHPEGPLIDYAYCRMGLAYRADHHWPEAIAAFGASIQETANDSLRDERRILLGTTLIASGNYNAAHLELLRVSQFSRLDVMRRRASYFRGLAYLPTLDYEGARQAFQGFYGPSSRSVAGRTVDSLLFEAQHLPHKSPTTARLLSTVLPGAGQVYAGQWKAGVNALALDGLIAAFTIRSFRENRHLDTSLLLLVLFERYYSGNRYHAAEIAKRSNERLDRQHADRIMRVLMAQRARGSVDSSDTSGE